MRKILGMKSTYIDRRPENTNKAVEAKILSALNNPKGEGGGNVEEGASNKGKGREKVRTREDIIPSENIKKRATQVLQQIIRDDPEKLLHRVTIRRDKQEPNLPSKLRVGRPRTCWLIMTAEEAWKTLGKTQGSETQGVAFNHRDKEIMKH